MSAYDNIVGSKLRLKGKPLDVKAGGVIKKKKKHRHQNSSGPAAQTGFNEVQLTDRSEDVDEIEEQHSKSNSYDHHLTPAERRFLQQTERLELQRLAKIAAKSHRDQIQEFNKYLANLSEHYDIPKVGPG